MRELPGRVPFPLAEDIEKFLRANERPVPYTTKELIRRFELGGAGINLSAWAKSRPDLAFKGPPEATTVYGRTTVIQRWKWKYDPTRQPAVILERPGTSFDQRLAAVEMLLQSILAQLEKGSQD